MLPHCLFSLTVYTLILLMASQEQSDATQVARDLLGSVSGRQLPPQVQVLPPAAAPEVPVAAAQVPVAAAPEEKGDPVPAVQAPQNANLGAQSNPPVTLHRRLLARLVRALPIASEGQLQAMLNVFSPSAAPPVDRDLTPPPCDRPLPPPPPPVQSLFRPPPPAAPPANPGGIPRGHAPSDDRLQHLLPQHSHKRSESNNAPPSFPLTVSPLPPSYL